jgi:20S proteasome subunit beta 5
MGTMVAGWDKTGPNLYYVDNDGLRIKNEKFSVSPCRLCLRFNTAVPFDVCPQVGSGSPYAFGVLDTGYHHDLSVADACELGRRAIYHATFRDAYVGCRAHRPNANNLTLAQLFRRNGQCVPHPRTRLDACVC